MPRKACARPCANRAGPSASTAIGTASWRAAPVWALIATRPGSTARSAPSMANCSAAASLIPLKSGMKPSLWAGFTVWPSGPPFFGESMFHRRTDASKMAMAHLVDRLNAGGFELLDTQFLTDHLASLGGIEIPRADYEDRLGRALLRQGDWTAWDK